MLLYNVTSFNVTSFDVIALYLITLYLNYSDLTCTQLIPRKELQLQYGYHTSSVYKRRLLSISNRTLLFEHYSHKHYWNIIKAIK